MRRYKLSKSRRSDSMDRRHSDNIERRHSGNIERRHSGNIECRHSGNALFLILIAVALFAALSYAITRSSRSGGSGIDREKDAITAAQIMQTVNNMRSATLRMHLGGLSPADIHINNGNTHMPCTQTDGSCLFTPDGGGMLWPTPGRVLPQEAFSQEIAQTAEAELSDISNNIIVVGAGTMNPDIVFVTYPIKESVCAALNKGLGIEGIPLQTAAGATANTGYITLDALEGKTVGCVDWSEISVTPGEYFFIAALLEN